MRFTTHTRGEIDGMLAVIGAPSLASLVEHVPAEAVLLAQRLRPGRSAVLVSRALHPQYRQVIATYLAGLPEVELVEVPYGPDGTTPLPARDLLQRASCLVLGYPNVLGVIED